MGVALGSSQISEVPAFDEIELAVSHDLHQNQLMFQ